MTENISYKGYALKVRRFTSGWIVEIYRPGSDFVERHTPMTRNYADKADLIDEAKTYVDIQIERNDRPLP